MALLAGAKRITPEFKAQAIGQFIEQNNLIAEMSERAESSIPNLTPLIQKTIRRVSPLFDLNKAIKSLRFCYNHATSLTRFVSCLV